MYGVEGAAGLCFDTGIYLFGKWVESEVAEAKQSSNNKMFANMYRARAFARCMGDDMSESSAGFADPAISLGTVQPASNRKRRKESDAQPGDEILWDEAG